MRADGDKLLAHVLAAQHRIVLCAPFIKVGVLKNLLKHVRRGVRTTVVTRWLPHEVALGVSDLEVFDAMKDFPDSELRLLDRLHAKMYQSDDRFLVGSANLTAAALGWSLRPNLELLTEPAEGDASTLRCLEQLGEARIATAEERERVSRLAAGLDISSYPTTEDILPGPPPTIWFPETAVPARLYQAYVEATRDRLMASSLEAAFRDISALSIPDGLSEEAFRKAVTAAFQAMGGIIVILAAAENDLDDSAGSDIISRLAPDDEMSSDARWLIVREWLTYFMSDRYEIAPHRFIVRKRPGAGRATRA